MLLTLNVNNTNDKGQLASALWNVEICRVTICSTFMDMSRNCYITKVLTDCVDEKKYQKLMINKVKLIDK